MTDYAKVLLAIAPRGKATIIAGASASLRACIDRADLNSSLRLAHFLAQVAHESAGFATTVEYASGAAYENRRDLGNAHPGDGRRYKGRGLIQLTGRTNYSGYGLALGVDLVGDPAQAAAFPLAATVAAEYWKRRDCNAPADRDDLPGVTRKINGGERGLDSRRTYLVRAKHALADTKGALVARAVEERSSASESRKNASMAATAAGAAQIGHAHPQAPWWAVAGLGMAIVILAVVAYRKATESEATANALTLAAREQQP